MQSISVDQLAFLSDIIFEYLLRNLEKKCMILFLLPLMVRARPVKICNRDFYGHICPSAAKNLRPAGHMYPITYGAYMSLQA